MKIAAILLFLACPAVLPLLYYLQVGLDVKMAVVTVHLVTGIFLIRKVGQRQSN